MNKLIYNNKFKRLMISYIVITLLFGYILPFKVVAATSYSKYNHSGSVENYVKGVTGQEKIDWDKFFKEDEHGLPLLKVLKNGFLKGMSDEQIIEMLSLDDAGWLSGSHDYFFAGAIYITYSDDYQIDPDNAPSITAEWQLADTLMAIARYSNHGMIDWGIIDNYKAVIADILNPPEESLAKYAEYTTISVGVERVDNRDILTMRFKVKEKAIAVNAFHRHLCPYGQNLAEFLLNNDTAFLGIVIETIDPNDLYAGGEDTRTEEEKIRDILVNKYDGLDSGEADVVIASGWYEVTQRDGDGNPTDVKLKDISAEQINAFGLSYEAQEIVYEDQMGDMVSVLDNLINMFKDFLNEPGAFLLNTIFEIVNFVVDAIIDLVGDLMSVVPKDRTITNDSSLTKDDVYRIDMSKLNEPKTIYVSKYTPEEIFAGRVELFSVDFISGENSEGQEINGEWKTVRSIIASWYKALRMFAIIGFLSVLIYTGIKIILSANAKDKAKYKEWIINWFIGVAILFSMHYIMSFIVSITGGISQMLNDASGNIIVEKIYDGNMNKQAVNTSNLVSTNLMGLIRTMVGNRDTITKIGYEIIYIALAFYTIKFTFIYLKRMLSMAFLTLIAPIVAFTYPIDKLNDGDAQGFNMWLKEYIYNALLQIVHCILYFTLIGSAATLAASNPIYGLAVLMFMTEAEKLLKKIFGFDKASGGTVGGLAGAFTAGAVASQIKNIVQRASKSSGGSNPGKGDANHRKNEVIDNPKPTDKDDDMRAFLDAPSNGENDRTEDSPGEANEGTNEAINEMEQEKLALESYKNAGYEQNADGHYFNPNIDDYDEEYNPANDEQFKPKQQLEQRTEKTSESTTESTPNPEQAPNSKLTPNRTTPIRKMSKFKKGMGAVGKRLLKPAWDLNHKGKEGVKYNFKRLGRKLGKGIVKGATVMGGLAVGTAAAAVQAGISITDGKYNPLEGMATIAAGVAGTNAMANKIGSGMESVAETYREGAYAGDKEYQMERAQKRFPDREDVIEFNRREYAGKEVEYMRRERDNYLPKGVTNLKDMKHCMKYADKLVGKTDGLDKKQIEEKRKNADEKAAATLNFRNTLKEQGQLSAVYDKDKQKKYIDTMVAQANQKDKETTRMKYENAFKSVAEYDSVKG